MRILRLQVFVRAILVASLSIFAITANAADLLTTAEHTFFSPHDQSRIGLEVEFHNLSIEQAIEILQSRLGGTLVKSTEVLKTTLAAHDAAGDPVYKELKNPVYILNGTKIGKVVLKAETNQVDDRHLKKQKVVLEVISDPIHVDDTKIFQTALDDLKKAGAKGTSPSAAVSIQVNAEIANGVKDEIKAKDIVNLLRSYYQPEHRKQIKEALNVPPNRRPYVSDPSPGFLKKLLDPNYNPSWREFYDDYVYRQSIELMRHSDAWTMPIEDARAALLSAKNPVVPRVVKQTAVRISSLLAFKVPEDPMSKQMIESGWIKSGPYIEFREFNNDFNVEKPVKQTLGLVRAAREYGYYDHDALLAELSGVEKETIQKLRDQSRRAKKNGKVVGFRYFLADPSVVDKEEYEEYKKTVYNKDEIVGYLSPNERGVKPLFIPGESVVIHRRPIHANNIRGKYNPGLINADISQALENKYVEAKFWEEYAPGSMPQSALLTDVTKGEKKVDKIVAALNEKYPQGWVLKGVWDLGTEDGIITSNDDIVALVNAYKKSDFEKFKAKIDADPSYKEAGQEYYFKELGKHKQFKGWKIAQMLEKQPLLMVQAKVPIEKEFRVEVLAGHVLNHGSTIDRYAYKFDYDPAKSKVSKEEIKAAENYVRELLLKLPNDLKGTPFAFDVALLKDGKFALIEANFGSNSNFLYEEDWKPSIRSLSEFIENYPELERRGLIRHGMSQEEQMKWLKEKFKEWHIDTKTMYKGFAFTETEVLDTEFPEKKVSEKNFQITNDRSCQRNYAKLFSSLRGKKPR